ncbi:uncharacterized protein ASCRUDRAFT_79401 [Ascoidea rubescens DSM 1968]|uniref:Uncharacterized protein n=1 Tax=Ascoidea rubescens DSM 1968 TaxID=1344418 RepID=A0A1D2VMD1_9ASCO|nr:hypothetical protein ASCRUDRAFT_79401 [Ascoidea rubescens DSM 1968]ODV62734.1 hypothetical protein ASCRUDRAFT_79401 [Ascoidea rubescens DSM 1968]
MPDWGWEWMFGLIVLDLTDFTNGCFRNYPERQLSQHGTSSVDAPVTVVQMPRITTDYRILPYIAIYQQSIQKAAF